MYLSRMNYAVGHGVGISEGEQSKWVRVMPERANHDKDGSNAASSWFPNNDAQGIIRSTVGARACCQCLVASWLGKLFAVITSPRKTTKSTHKQTWNFRNAQTPQDLTSSNHMFGLYFTFTRAPLVSILSYQI